MNNLNAIENAIKDERDKLLENFDYEGTSECCNNEVEILDAYKNYFNYDVQEDMRAMDYFIKCTLDEIWQYHIDKIIPRLKRLKK